MLTGISDSDVPATSVTMILDAPNRVSVHELDTSVTSTAVLVEAGDRVVTEKSGTVIVLKLTDSVDDRQLVAKVEHDVLNAGEGEIVTSDGVEAVVWAVVSPTDCAAELSNVHDELDRAEVGSMSAVEAYDVLSSGESMSVAEIG